MNVKCWVGEPGEEPADSETSLWFEETVDVTTNHPFGVYGNVDISTGDAFSCNWNYTLSSTTSILDEPVYGVGQHHALSGDSQLAQDFGGQIADRWIPEGLSESIKEEVGGITSTMRQEWLVEASG